ncbi:hypothetical protein SDC9_06247 [bioreactor metagenome]|uniref:Uncharacterized protein n=1 Tax=bioreactor metagenome TaxID=1076179 RepID=A0A644T1F1_9ZZZZ|nr:hypothetical protein [Negativicutes bacterium]
MHKLRCALGLALIVGILTLITSFLSDIRLWTILYRFVISFILFGVLGYILASTAEKFALPGFKSVNVKGQKVDIISKEESTNENNSADSSKENLFIAFTPDNLERIPKSED